MIIALSILTGILFIAILLLWNKFQQINQSYKDLQNQHQQLVNEYQHLKKTYQEHLIQLSTIKATIDIQEKIISEQKQQIESLLEENKKLHAEKSSYVEKVSQLDRLLQSQKQDIEQIQQQLKKEFQLISTQILEQNTQKLTEQNAQILHQNISPVKEYLQQMKELEQKIQRYYDNENKEKASLLTKIEELTRRSDEVKQTAETLAKALTSQVKHQGYWGEFILEKILELSGLEKGTHYTIQNKFRTANDSDDDSKYKQPDVIIHLPNSKHIIIDSKVTLNALIKYQSTHNEEEKSKYLEEITTSITKHVNDLSRKNYEQIPELNSIDFILMFIPIEYVMSIVQQYQPNLFSEAVSKKVLIVTPTSLLATLKTIYFIWQQDKIQKDIESILEDIKKVYEKIGVFISHFEKIEKKLEEAQRSYYDAHKSLVSGKGNVMSILKNMEYYINPKKSITKSLPENLSEDE